MLDVDETRFVDRNTMRFPPLESVRELPPVVMALVLMFSLANDRQSGAGFVLGIEEGGRRRAGQCAGPNCFQEGAAGGVILRSSGRDWILTRILWLSGCEPGRNRLGQVDSFRRYIYLHGTPDTEPMGVPLSHGCIRLRNADVLELFDRVPVHCAVRIDEAPCPDWAAAQLS